MGYLERATMGLRHDEHAEDSADNEGIVLAKVVAMVVLSVATFFLGMLPCKLAVWLKWNRKQDGALHKSEQSKLILSLLLCFGGGALLCTTFMHMLPEVRETVEELQAEGRIAEVSFHLTELIMCCGFFTMYMVEELVHIYLHWREGSRGTTVEDQAIHRSFSLRKCPGTNEETEATEDNQSLSKKSLNYPSVTVIASIKGADVVGQKSQSEVDILPHVGHSHMHISSRDDPVVASVRGLLVVLALSIHELFEGLAVGLQTSTGYVWYMLGAVSAHKLVIAFCVGVELVSSRTTTMLHLIYISTFALVSPIGIAIGLGMSDNSSETVQGGVPNAILQGMATGTLLYVVFFEVLQKERASRDSGIKQLLAIMGGFAVMFGLLLAVGHEHEHGHSHDEEGDNATHLMLRNFTQY